ncbi:MAG: hypothetical protein AB7N61_22200 [Acidimicrobiia bacterium]
MAADRWDDGDDWDETDPLDGPRQRSGRNLFVVRSFAVLVLVAIIAGLVWPIINLARR